MFFFGAFPGHAQEKEVATPALQGQGLFIENCSTCHQNANETPKAPSQQTLMQMTPEAVLSALTSGPMAVQVKSLSDAEKRLIAIYLGGRPLGSAEAGDAKTMPNHCASSPDLGDPLAGAA
jgi:mono/diheme cytochrome c family protein